MYTHACRLITSPGANTLHRRTHFLMGSEGVLRRVQWLDINQQIARVARLAAARKDEVDGPSDTWLRGWVRGYLHCGCGGAGKLVGPCDTSLSCLSTSGGQLREASQGQHAS